MQTESAKDVTRRTAWITLGQGVHTASQILVATFLARWMSNSDWSKMAYLMSIYFAMLVVANLGLHHGMPYFISHLNPHGQRRVVFRSMSALFVSGLVVSAVLSLASGALTKQWDGLAGLVTLMGIVIAVELPSTICAMALVAMKHSLLSAIWEGSMGLVTLITVFGLFIQDKGLRSACVGLLIAGVVRSMTAVIALLWATQQRNDQNWLNDSSTIPRIRDQIMFALPLGATIIVSVLNRSLDKWLVAALHPERLGEYAIAAQELPIINILPVAGGAAIAVSLVHHLARGEQQTALKIWIEQSIRLTYVLVPAVITSENSLSPSGEQSEQRTLQPTSLWPPQQSQAGNYVKMALTTSPFGRVELMQRGSTLPSEIWIFIANGPHKDKQLLVTWVDWPVKKKLNDYGF